MRSWSPRQPAAALKAKIFHVAEPATPHLRWFWGALAPTMACALLTLMAFNRSGDGFDAKPIMAMVLSNQSYAAYASGGAQTAQNHLAAVTFDSTNRSSFRSIIGFTPTTNFSN
jgi:hypothetical protein